MGDASEGLYLRARADFLNGVSVVLWTTSYIVCTFFTLIWTSENSIMHLYENSIMYLYGINSWFGGAIDFRTPTPLREFDTKQPTHCWKELSILLSPLLTFPSSFIVRAFLSCHFTKNGLHKVTGDFLLTQSNGYFSGIFLPLTGVGNSWSFLSFFSFFSRVITLYPRELGSSFSDFSYTTEPGKILATKY